MDDTGIKGSTILKILHKLILLPPLIPRGTSGGQQLFNK